MAQAKRPARGEGRRGYAVFLGHYEPGGRTRDIAVAEYQNGFEAAMYGHQLFGDDLFDGIARGFVRLLHDPSLSLPYDPKELISLSADMQACLDAKVDSGQWEDFPVDFFLKHVASNADELREVAARVHLLIDLLIAAEDISAAGGGDLHQQVQDSEQTIRFHRIWAKPRRGLPRAMN